jgi:transposase
MIPLGLDIGSQTISAALILEAQTHSLELENSESGFKQLQTWLETRVTLTKVHATMEATSVYWKAIAVFLHALCVQVSVVNPMQIKNFARTKLSRGKTDVLDAKLIAEFTLRMQPSVWHPQTQTFEEIKSLTRALDNLKRSIRREGNQLHSVQRSIPRVESVITSLEQRIAFLKDQQVQLEIELERVILETPEVAEDYALLKSVPGIGVVTASLLLAETRGGLKQFSARGISAFAGLNPCPRESGLMKGKAVLSGLGNPRLRRGFYMAALSASRGKNRFAVMNQRLREAGKPGKVALIAVAHKILTVAVAVVRSGVPFNPRFLEERLTGLTGSQKDSISPWSGEQSVKNDCSPHFGISQVLRHSYHSHFLGVFRAQKPGASFGQGSRQPW